MSPVTSPAASDHRPAVVAGFLGWTLDAFDFFIVVMTLTAIGREFGKTDVQMALSISLTLAFRLVPVFFDAALTVVQAQRCRGLAFERGGLVVRLRRFVPVIVPVLIGALRRADRMAMALELRGFNSGRPRTTYLRAQFGSADVVAGALALGTAAVYVGLWVSGAGTLAPLP